MQYYEATLHINSIYAQRHGYKFIHQGSGAYGKLDKHMSWMKLQMIRDQLECCCQFALFLDSDSFIADQKLSIEAWLGESLSLHNPTETDPTAMVSDNAPYIGYCAANLIFTRTQRSAEILHYWYNDTVKVDDSSLWKHPWEQHTLNDFVMQKYRPAFYIASSKDVNSMDGNFIRHLWHLYGNDFRSTLSAFHLKKVLRDHLAESRPQT